MEELSLNILDIVQNSITAKSTNIEIEIAKIDEFLYLIIEDNGYGMEEKFLKKVTSPFETTRTTRKVGLGIPLLKQASEQAFGEFKIESKLKVGTKISASFKYDNIDRIPLGDIAETMICIILSNDKIEYTLKFSSEKGTFTFSTKEVKEEIQGISITTPDVLVFIKEFINENLENIFGGILNEITIRASRN